MADQKQQNATPSQAPKPAPSIHVNDPSEVSAFDFASRVHAASVSPVLPCAGGATPAERARAAIEFVRTVQQALDAERT